MIQFEEHIFQMGWLKPPTSNAFHLIWLGVLLAYLQHLWSFPNLGEFWDIFRPRGIVIDSSFDEGLMLFPWTLEFQIIRVLNFRDLLSTLGLLEMDAK